MKTKLKIGSLLVLTLLLNSISFQAQNGSKKNNTALIKRPELINLHTSQEAHALKTTQITNCTDKINYVGNNSAYYLDLGGTGNALTGTYQSFIGYEGKVIGVEFEAAKSATVAGNPVVYVRIFDSNVSPSTNFPLSQAIAVTITNTAYNTYSVTFPTPITITNGEFVVGILNSNTSSRPKISMGVLLPNNLYNYSWVTDVYGGTYPYNLTSYFTTSAIDFLIRPIVTTSVNPAWVATRTSTGCALPVNYDFNNTSPAPSFYVNNYTMTCPGGMDDQIDFGDGTPPQPFYFSSHSYTALGNYVASFSQTYIGWTNNCIGTLTANIQVDNPTPSFSYTINGLNVTFNNTSTGMTGFVWNFGDLSTSTQENPGTHSFNTPGTYVVELEGTAACGKVRYSVSIVLSGVGIHDNNALSETISIYPNPAVSRLQINNATKMGLNESIDIYNSFGQLVKTIQSKEMINGIVEIDLSNFSTGVYFVKITSKNQSAIKSFIKE